jgi:hypothetical protein
MIIGDLARSVDGYLRPLASKPRCQVQWEVSMLKANKTRLTIASALLGAIILSPILSAKAANAAIARYCLRVGSSEHCNYRTMEQCQAARHGQGGGFCHRKSGT